MPEPTQSRRRHTHRLLLLTGLSIGAGLGIALATGSPAHADNRPTPIADTLHGAAHLLTPADDRPRPVRDLTAKALADTRHTTRRVASHIDHAVAPLPVAGRAVDKATDLTTAIVDTATRPHDRRHAAATMAAPAVEADAPQTAPEPATPGAPTPDDTSSGAPTPHRATTGAPDRTAAIQHPATAHHTGRRQDTRAVHRWQSAADTPAAPGNADAGPCRDAGTQRAGDSIRTLDYATTGQGCAIPPPHGEPDRTSAGHHDGRTQPPSPPPG